MGTTADGGLTAVTAVLLVLFVATVFGRIHGQEGDVPNVGDRVISGLLALPLIALWLDLIFPKASIGWKLAAPLPLAIYIVLLWCTSVVRPSILQLPDRRGPLSSGRVTRRERLIGYGANNFTLILVITSGLIYVVFVIVSLAVNLKWV